MGAIIHEQMWGFLWVTGRKIFFLLFNNFTMGVTLNKLNLHQDRLEHSVLCLVQVKKWLALSRWSLLLPESSSTRAKLISKLNKLEKHWHGINTGMCFEFYYYTIAEWKQSLPPSSLLIWPYGHEKRRERVRKSFHTENRKTAPHEQNSILQNSKSITVYCT